MDFEFLISDLNKNLFQKTIGTDKGLAKIGDGIVNLAYSVAKSSYLTNNSKTIIRTGLKVSKTILSNALKNANLKNFAKNRANAHDLANTVEALIAYVWLNNNITLNEIIKLLIDNISGDLTIRTEEIKNATIAFTNLLNHVKKFLPVK
ncbi:MAG: ribonuclease III family protein [Promethearchaeota archaeon]